MKTKTTNGMIKPNDKVKVTIARGEVTLQLLRDTNNFTKRISNDVYVNTKTGEITRSKRGITKGDNLVSLNKSQKRLIGLIKENTIDNKKILLLTLTYEERQDDNKKLGEDFDYFIDKVRKTYTQFGRIEYIYVPELHKEGGYHIHAILFCNKSTKNVFIDLWELSKIWGKGYMSISQPKQFQEVFNYLAPHRCNEVTDLNRKMHEKAVKLETMPIGQRLYRSSRGLKKPIVYTDNKESVQKFLDNEEYELAEEFVYGRNLDTYNGNCIWHCKQIYKKKPKP